MHALSNKTGDSVFANSIITDVMISGVSLASLSSTISATSSLLKISFISMKSHILLLYDNMNAWSYINA